MKKIMSIISLVLIVTSLVGKEKEPKFLQLKGSFLNETNVQYTVYKMTVDKGYMLQKEALGKNQFSITCELNHTYLIEFESKTKELKTLLVIASINGVFYIDVDFSKTESVKLEFDNHKYKLTNI